MSSRRFPGVELEEWRSRLMDAHPRLFSDARPIFAGGAWLLAGTGRPDVPDGWRRVLELACARLDAAIRNEDGELSIVGAEEKHGGLRLNVVAASLSAEAQDAVELAVDLAEFRSVHVCALCGEPGGFWSDGGWLSVRCDRHGEGKPTARTKGHQMLVTTRWVDGKSYSTARRYLPDKDEFEAVPATEPHDDEH